MIKGEQVGQKLSETQNYQKPIKENLETQDIPLSLI